MKISVCIPTYNQSQYLKIAIDSVLAQTVIPGEIIVSNDCSTDNTMQVLEDLLKTVTQLIVINQTVNLGIAKNTDACLRKATGDYIVRLDSDDYLDRHYCERLSELLTQFPQAGYAHANVSEVNQNGDIIGKRRLYRQKTYINPVDALKAASKGYRVSANIIMFRRKALESVDYCSGRPNYVEDYHLSSHLAAEGWGNAYCNEFLAFYRVWVDVAKVRQRRKMMEIVGLRRVFTEILEPGYVKSGINVSSLKNSRRRLACNQADCLGWNVYSQEEKIELKEALFQLSSSPITKVYSLLYEKKLGSILNAFNNLKKSAQKVLKSL